MGGGMIIWNYVVGRLYDLSFYLDCILIQKNKLIEFSWHVLFVNPRISDETNT